MVHIKKKKKNLKKKDETPNSILQMRKQAERGERDLPRFPHLQRGLISESPPS